MATVRQKRLAKALVENAIAKEPLNLGELVESVGYSPVTADAKPGLIIEQKGVQEELAEMGFTVENAKKVVAEIMLSPEAKEASRLQAAGMIFDVHGTYAPEKNINVTMSISEVLDHLEKDNG